MNNPFETIELRLSNIETLLLDIKHQPKAAGVVNHEEKLMSVNEAADFLNLTPPTIYSKVSRGELPCMKRSKRLYFSSKDLLKYVKEGRRETLEEIAGKADEFLTKKKGPRNGK